MVPGSHKDPFPSLPQPTPSDAVPSEASCPETAFPVPDFADPKYFTTSSVKGQSNTNNKPKEVANPGTSLGGTIH